MTSTRVKSYVGRSIPRVEDHRLVTGTGAYGADFDRQGQLHARVLRSDVAHGVIHSIDADPVASRPGVVRVITARDLPDVHVPVRLFPTANAERTLQPPLARERVRYVGEPIAVVVAADPYVAEDAADDLRVEIEPLDPVLDTASRRGRSSTRLRATAGCSRSGPACGGTRGRTRARTGACSCPS
jgi:carbon-monoxide dehydrogenase large subunit